ncbi:MAG: dephospho-CoA kinase [Bacteroidales bacterium]|nr:dephospho-CoA kinase [Bacteroidales bacterium]MBQ3845463.1 dephospho-CoA kinase [Bacteroidales bacterium]
MKKIGITGNIGSGKSYVCKMFENLGIPVFYSDDETKKLYLVPSVKTLIINRFGNEVYFEDGTLNRKLLSYHLFKNEEAMKFIESVLYPALNQHFDEWCEQQTTPYVLYESAILFEKNYEKFFDKIIFVSAAESIRLQRVMKRDDCSEENVRSRMRLQLNEETKISRADFVIYNDGIKAVEPQVEAINKLLCC